MKKKIVVFGAGKLACRFIPELKKEYDIRAIYDNNPELWGKELYGMLIEMPSNISSAQYEFIAIVSVYWKEILRQLYTEFELTNAMLLQPCDDYPYRYHLKRLFAIPFYQRFKFDDRILNKKKLKTNDDEIKPLNNKRRILFVAYYFPPLGSSPVQRTLKFVKYLSYLGHDVTVLTVDESAKWIQDKRLLEEIPENVKVIRVPDYYNDMEFLSCVEQRAIFDFICSVENNGDFLSEWKYAQYEQSGYILPDRLIQWAITAVNNIEELVDLNKIDVLYSTVPEWSPHLVAYILKERYGIPWVGDYRDPWVADQDYVEAVYPYMTRREVEWDKKLEKTLLSKMDSVIIAGQNWKMLFEKEYDIPQEKINVISNGYDEEDFSSLSIREHRNEKFTLCYNGVLGYNRKPSFLLEMLSKLIRDGRIGRDKITWVFNGPISDHLYNQEIVSHDPFHITKCNGMLSHIDSLQIAINADLMIMYGESGKMGELNYPGKFYEYLRIGRPIICFSEAGSPQEIMLKETNLGKNFRLNDDDGVKKFLLQFYDEWCIGIVSKPVDSEAVKRYDRQVLSRKLEKVIMAIS